MIRNVIWKVRTGALLMWSLRYFTFSSPYGEILNLIKYRVSLAMPHQSLHYPLLNQLKTNLITIISPPPPLPRLFLLLSILQRKQEVKAITLPFFEWIWDNEEMNIKTMVGWVAVEAEVRLTEVEAGFWGQVQVNGMSVWLGSKKVVKLNTIS